MFFLACDIQTGQIQAELPLACGDSFERAMQTISTAGFKLPIHDPACPRDWEALTAPWRFWIVAVLDDGTICWGGIITGRSRDATSGVVSISCSSPEDYLDRRYTPAKRFDQVDQSDIAAWLVRQAIPDGIPFLIDAPKSGVKRDREYNDDDAATLYKRLSDLSGVIGGPEWHIAIEWQDRQKQNAIIPVFKCGTPRIGIATDSPQSVFELPGGLIEATLEERFGESEYATHVMAAGGGEGEDRPLSSPMIDAARENAGYPRVEVRKTFDSVTLKPTLDTHAKGLLAALSGGVQVFTLTQKLDEYPRLGIDWHMGDDVRLVIDTDTLKIDRKIRVVGWSLDPAKELVKPYVAQIGG